MLKSMLTAAIIVTAFTTSSIAGEKTISDHKTDNNTLVARTTPVATNKRIPVILQNEAVAPGVCRLHLDNGTKLEVSCSQTEQEPI